MSKKKSLGHNPLSYSMRRHASFDFISPSSEEEADRAIEQVQKPKKVNKLTVSYYLEEPLVNKIKAIAKARETSYSAIVNEMLKNSVKHEEKQ